MSENVDVENERIYQGQKFCDSSKRRGPGSGFKIEVIYVEYHLRNPILGVGFDFTRDANFNLKKSRCTFEREYLTVRVVKP